MTNFLALFFPIALTLLNQLVWSRVGMLDGWPAQLWCGLFAVTALAYATGLLRPSSLKPENHFQPSANLAVQHAWVQWVLMAGWTIAWALAWLTAPLLNLHKLMLPLLFFGLMWQRLGAASTARPTLRRSMGLTLLALAGFFALLVLNDSFFMARMVNDWTGPLDLAHRHYHHAQVLKAWSAIQLWGPSDLSHANIRMNPGGLGLLRFAVRFGALPAILLGAALVLGCVALWNWLQSTPIGPHFSAALRRLGLALMAVQGIATVLYVLFNLGITRRMGGSGLPPLVPQVAWWILDATLLWIMVKALAAKRSATAQQTAVPQRGRRWWISLLGYALSTCVLATTALVFKEYQRDNGNYIKLANHASFVTRKPILDANGNVIAHNVLAYGLWFKPTEFWAPSLLNPRSSYQQDNGREPRRTDAERERLLLGALAPWPQMQQAVQAKLAAWPKSKDMLANLAWAITPEMAEKVKTLAMPGLQLKPRTARHYPDGALYAHALGFAGLSQASHGQDGLELVANRQLTTLSAKPDASDQPALRTTLVPAIQRAARDTLQAGVKQHHALGGAIVVMDVRSNQVVAMVSAPDFDPNDSSSYRFPYQPERLLNRSVSVSFPVGSLLTPLVVAQQLESDQITADTTIHLGREPLVVGGLRIRDAHVWEDLNVGDVIAKSSNIGFAKLALQMPLAQLAGISQTLELGHQLTIPGVTVGSTVKRTGWQKWTPAMQATAGMRIETNLMQILTAYLPIANTGLLGTPTLLQTDRPWQSGKRVLSEQTAASVRAMLTRAVTVGGTAPRAQVMGSAVAGKTATQQFSAFVDDDTGDKVARPDSAAFVGMLPAEQPRWLVGVLLEFDHGNGKFAGATSASMFATLASKALVSGQKP